MAIPWGSIKSLLIFFGPILLPKAVAYYRKIRNAPRDHGLKVKPVPKPILRVLLFLSLIALFFLSQTLPTLAPENIFAVTNSRLQIPVDVLFNRLTALRPNNTLSPADQALKHRFVNLESRLLYLQFGPAVLASCPFCVPDDPRSYLYYALPDILAPHLLNLVAVALATSRLVSGRDGAAWRVAATIAAVGLAFADVYLVSTYNHQANSRALRLAHIDPFFWTARRWRHVLLAGLDLVLGLVLYLSSTNRMFVNPPLPAERVEGIARVLQGVKGKINAAGVVKNAAVRDDELRARGAAYWTHEVNLVRECMEEREVVDGVNDALANRIDIAGITKDAEAYAGVILRGPPSPVNGEDKKDI